MKRILVTGGSHAELPMIRYLKEKGCYVITTGSNMEGIGHKEADKYVCGDFSDKDFVYNLACKEKIDGIISGCNDFAYLSTAYVCEKLGFKGHDDYETACIIHHKDKFRKFTDSIGIRTPRMEVCVDRETVKKAVKKLGFPVMVKPVDLTGGKGVKICCTLDETYDAFEDAYKVTREKYVILEEYITGTAHGTSVVIKNGKVIGGICDNEFYYKNKYLVSGTCFPSVIPFCTMLKLYSDIEKIANRLNLVDGIFHTQFIVEKGNNPVIIDPCRRAPGDLYVLFAKYSTGIDFPALFVEAELGENIPERFEIKYKNIARMCVMTDRTGKYGGIEIPNEIKKHIIDQVIWAEYGEEIEDFYKYKAGILFLEYDDFKEVYDCCENFYNNVKIKYC